MRRLFLYERKNVFMEVYRTLQKSGERDFTEKKSRFIGYAFPVSTEKEAQDFLQMIRKRHWDAKHNVSAYVLKDGIQHCSDDGEPQGTAGVPVMNVLLKNGVVNAMIVVTRYFGGILLGTGGLVRAYSHTASLALEDAGIVTMYPGKNLSLSCSYSQYGKVSALIPQYGGKIDKSEFGAEVKLQFHIKSEKFHFFQTEFTEATSGAICVKIEGETYFCE